MPVLDFPALLITLEARRTDRARIRYGGAMARRLKRCRRPRRMRFEVNVLSTRGCQPCTIAAITLYGATLITESRLQRRELVALRLPSGQRVKARVWWRLGRRCGITYLEPVAGFARLLSENRALRGQRRPRSAPWPPDLWSAFWARWLRQAAVKADRLYIRCLQRRRIS
jgi:hypothetical protein